jgi:hypothetical protein
MYADGTSILNIGQVRNELQKIIQNTGLVEQYFEGNNLSVNPSKRSTFSSRQSSPGRKVN